MEMAPSQEALVRRTWGLAGMHSLYGHGGLAGRHSLYGDGA